MQNTVLEFFVLRHSFYDLNNQIPVKDNILTQIITKSLELYPSPFNSQSSRLVVLFNREHSHFWSLVQQTLLATAPKDKEEAIVKRIQSFAAGYGTILYFIDKSIISKQEKQMPLYAADFMNWAFQSSAILQFMIWCTLAEKNIGANIQHYNPLINDTVKKAFNLNKNWELVAQMPFGGINNVPKPHIVENISEKIIIKNS